MTREEATAPTPIGASKPEQLPNFARTTPASTDLGGFNALSLPSREGG